MDVRTFFIIGKPGSGKGTQAKLLSEKMGWPTFSSGEAFREIARGDTVAGERMRDDMDQGYLMPDWFANYLFQKTVFGLTADEGAIFDGFGRKVPEAKLDIEVLNWLRRPFKAVHVVVSDDAIRERLEKRRNVSGRADDNSIEKRLEEYRLYTEPSIQVFKDAGVLLEVDGSADIETTHKRLLETLQLT